MRLTLLTVLALLVGTTACTSSSTAPTTNPVVAAGCSVEQLLEAGISTSIASGLKCANPSVIAADIASALGKVNLCPAAVAAIQKPAKVKNGAAVKGVIGDVVCPLAVNSVVALATGAIPATWGCTGGATVAQLTTIVTSACESAVPL